MNLENFECVAMDATEMTEIDGGGALTEIGKQLMGLGTVIIGSGLLM